MDQDDRANVAQKSTELPSYKWATAIAENAKAVARNFTSSYDEDCKFALGENQWPTPLSFRAWRAERWKSRTVRNYTFATINHKMAVCLDAEPTVRAEPMDELSTFEQRQMIASVVRHELDRLRWKEYFRRAMWDGAVCGTGIIQAYVVRNEFNGMYEIRLARVDPRRFYPDPSAEMPHECKFIAHEVDMDMPEVRRTFPDTWHLVKPDLHTLGKMNEADYSRTQDELIRGPATGELTITKDGLLQDRRANITFLYIKDPEVIKDVKSVLDRPPMEGYKCSDCGNEFERDVALISPDTMKPRCPDCDSENLAPTMLAPQFVQEIERTMAYPNGRLLAFQAGRAMLSDDANPYQLNETFPYAKYTHNSIGGRFWGYGDVALLKRGQEALNKHVAQALDYMRLAGNGPMEIPAEVPAWRHLGNGPSEKVPTPAPFMGLARYVTPNGYAIQLHQILDEALKRDFQEVSGVSDVSFGAAPVSPTSGVEVQARQRAASTRLGLNLQDLNQAQSDLANIVYQMMHQFYPEERAYRVYKVNGELESIAMSVQMLPLDVQVKISANLEKIQKDENFAQNMMLAVQAGQLGFYPDLMLPMWGGDPEVSREIQMRERDRLAQMQALQAAMPPGGAPGQSPPEAVSPASGAEAALAAQGV